MSREDRLASTPDGHYVTPRDFVSAVFRHRRLITFSFLGILLGAVLYALLRTQLYEAEMEILVNRERVDPVVTNEAVSMPRLSSGITEQDLNSEIELLISQDLLEDVAVTCGLHTLTDKSLWASAWKRVKAGLGVPAEKDNRIAIANAVLRLQRDLRVELVLKSNTIKVTYASFDPELSTRVLNTLADLYLKKHLAVRRPPGAFDFFQQETDRYRKGLAVAETRLADFSRDQNAIAAEVEKEMTLRKLVDFDAALQETQADIEATKARIRTLEAQARSTPSRLTTQVRKSSARPEQLQSMLLNLELKHIELLGLFQPTYPSVQEVEKQIAATRGAIAAAEKTSVLEETTDRDPTYEWVRSELTKAKSELAGLQARGAATTQILGGYRVKARRLDQMEMVQQNLIREAKLTEQNYLVYARKQEEARISDELDRQRIVNVAIAEKASAPLLPSTLPASLILLLGGFLASVVSVGLGFAADQLDTSFRTPHELEAFLNIPVAAAMPENVSKFSASNSLRTARATVRGNPDSR